MSIAYTHGDFQAAPQQHVAAAQSMTRSEMQRKAGHGKKCSAKAWQGPMLPVVEGGRGGGHTELTRLLTPADGTWDHVEYMSCLAADVWCRMQPGKCAGLPAAGAACFDLLAPSIRRACLCRACVPVVLCADIPQAQDT